MTLRPFTELLGKSNFFGQRSLLSPKNFIKQYNKRVLRNEYKLRVWEQLEELYQSRILIPMFRLKKDVKAINKLKRSVDYEDVIEANSMLNFDIPSPQFIINKDKYISVFDPRFDQEGNWYKYFRVSTEGNYWNSSFTFSPYQLLLTSKISVLIPNLKSVKTGRKISSYQNERRYKLRLEERKIKTLQMEAEKNSELVFILTSIESQYFPRIKGHWYSAVYQGSNIDELKNYQRKFNPAAELQFLNCEPSQILEMAKHLLLLADQVDPLGKWYKLVRLCHPEKLQELRGDALIALDHRQAAEMLLMFYEDLVKIGLAPEIDKGPSLVRSPLETRLKSKPSELNETLMDFGISPYPSVALVLEGETDEFFIRRVMKLLNIPENRYLTDIFVIRGIDKDFGLLARYIAVPVLGQEYKDFVELRQPPTRFFVVLDAEGRFLTEKDREEERLKWIRGIHSSLPEAYQTEEVKIYIDHLIDIDTWDEQVFEFAHFTDLEIGKAMVNCYFAHERTFSSLYPILKVKSRNELIEKLTENVGIMRPSGNIEKLSNNWKYRPPKTEIAKELWPVLELKIKQDLEDDDFERLSIVRLLLKVEKSAFHVHRRNVGFQK